jgi:HAD superfamily hydrolase (TIGR01484 family)
VHATPATPVDFSEADAGARTAVTRVFFDVDDTLTWHGQLPEIAASALYKARALGLSLVAVTGRSYAWAELLMRFFPLDAAVAETGACAFVRDGATVVAIHSITDVHERDTLADSRRAACKRALHDVDTARLALDNYGRVYDSAFDLVESGPPVPPEDARAIRAILEEEGLTTAQSSVHINAWFGAHDKATMVTRLFPSLADAVYIGDSMNDGAMFERVALSVGVANVKPHLPALAARGQAPRYVVDGNGGHGFAQIINALVEDR